MSRRHNDQLKIVQTETVKKRVNMSYYADGTPRSSAPTLNWLPAAVRPKIRQLDCNENIDQR